MRTFGQEQKSETSTAVLKFLVENVSTVMTWQENQAEVDVLAFVDLLEAFSIVTGMNEEEIVKKLKLDPSKVDMDFPVFRMNNVTWRTAKTGDSYVSPQNIYVSPQKLQEQGLPGEKAQYIPTVEFVELEPNDPNALRWRALRTEGRLADSVLGSFDTDQD